MKHPGQALNPSQAARHLGISAKALRLYEQRGLVTPIRTAAGWRTYGPAELHRAAEIVALRALGLSLAQVARVLSRDERYLNEALATHQKTLETQARDLADVIEKVGHMRKELAQGRTPESEDLLRLTRPAAKIVVDLPWPWGGERFELHDITPLTYITGPLGSGKTRLAHAITDALPGATFLPVERLEDRRRATAQAAMHADLALKQRVDEALAWLVDEGATPSANLVTLLVSVVSGECTPLTVDMIEQGLDKATQESLMAYLRRGLGARPLFMLTRSNAILDLADVAPGETIILCPANHSPPICVAPYPGAPGYEAVATCLAPPDVRARTEGMIAWCPQVA